MVGRDLAAVTAVWALGADGGGMKSFIAARKAVNGCWSQNCLASVIRHCERKRTCGRYVSSAAIVYRYVLTSLPISYIELWTSSGSIDGLAAVSRTTSLLPIQDMDIDLGPSHVHAVNA